MDTFLYSDIVLRSQKGPEALHRALAAHPSRTTTIKHFTYLYDLKDDGFGDPSFSYASNAAKDSHKSPTEQHLRLPHFQISSLYQLSFLRSLTVRLCSTRNNTCPIGYLLDDLLSLYWDDPSGGTDYRHAISTSCPYLSAIETNLGYKGIAGGRFDLNSAELSVPSVQTIKIRRVDASQAVLWTNITPDSDLMLKTLVLEDCETHVKGLASFLKLTKHLKNLRLSKCQSIRRSWNEEAQWVDVLQALRDASLHEQIQSLVLASRTERYRIISCWGPLDIMDFKLLTRLTINTHSSLRNLPDSLRTLSFVRSGSSRGACLPLLESRLCEVRKCALSSQVTRKVNFEIYDSLSVMADNWASIGFEAELRFHE